MQNMDFNRLQYLGVYNSGTKVADVSIISSLSTATKLSIKYMYFYGNNLISIDSFLDFSNTVEVKVDRNSKISTLHRFRKYE